MFLEEILLLKNVDTTHPNSEAGNEELKERTKSYSKHTTTVEKIQLRHDSRNTGLERNLLEVEPTKFKVFAFDARLPSPQLNLEVP